MKKIIYLLFSIFILNNSCKKSGSIDDNTRFNITVVGKTWECSSYEIRFENDLQKVSQVLGGAISKDVYTVVNLPEKYQASGTKLSASIRQPNGNEKAVFCFAITLFPTDLVYLTDIRER